MTSPWKIIGIALVLLAPLGAPGHADAQWLLTADGEAALPVTGWTGEAFGPGGSLGIGLYVPVTDWFIPGLRLRGALLSDVESPDATRRDPGLGELYVTSLSVRLRIPRSGAERGTGLYIEGGGGVGLTGGLLRPTIEAALGYDFPVGSIAIGPTARFVQVIQPDDASNLESGDARIVMAGIQVTLADDHAEPAAPGEPGRSDRDLDGIFDDDDACPDEPEDFDLFEDEDGCPEVDNDRDGVFDTEDACPLVPEDRDGFEDEDGCPDPDNDNDRILDADDACPNEPETINGVDDRDGCPDEGLIEMVEDRIVLDERVLFDFDRWHIRNGAWSVLRAIVTLWEQHPEWGRIRIEGHADYRGRDSYNLVLSERRARSVAAALVELGMPQQLFETVGYGSTRPRINGYGSRALQRNRRVEFVVVEQGEAPENARPSRPDDSGPSTQRAEVSR